MKMKSSELKYYLQEYLYWHNFTMTCTEFEIYSGRADVFALQRNGYSHEYEIKVSWADFMSEIRVMDYIINGETERVKIDTLDKNKLCKHDCYRRRMPGPLVPNKFTFVLDQSLNERFLESNYAAILLEQFRYGVLVYYQDGKRSLDECFLRSHVPEFLHKEKFSRISKFMQRIFVEHRNNSFGHRWPSQN